MHLVTNKYINMLQECHKYLKNCDIRNIILIVGSYTTNYRKRLNSWKYSSSYVPNVGNIRHMCYILHIGVDFCNIRWDAQLNVHYTAQYAAVLCIIRHIRYSRTHSCLPSLQHVTPIIHVQIYPGSSGNAVHPQTSNLRPIPIHTA